MIHNATLSPPPPPPRPLGTGAVSDVFPVAQGTCRTRKRARGWHRRRARCISRRAANHGQCCSCPGLELLTVGSNNPGSLFTAPSYSRSDLDCMSSRIDRLGVVAFSSAEASEKEREFRTTLPQLWTNTPPPQFLCTNRIHRSNKKLTSLPANSSMQPGPEVRSMGNSLCSPLRSAHLFVHDGSKRFWMRRWIRDPCGRSVVVVYQRLR